MCENKEIQKYNSLEVCDCHSHARDEPRHYVDSLKIKLVFFNGTPPHFVHFCNKIIPAKYEKN